jgi:CubicO group peptidase (beta-lactamase class C family)
LPPGFLPRSLANRNPYAGFDADALYAALEHTDIQNGNGRYEYSNFGFMWLSEILARRGGKPFEVLLEERILDPLGMRDTAITLSPEQRDRFVAGHDAAYREVPHWEFARDMGGAGALRSSLRDMLKLASAIGETGGFHSTIAVNRDTRKAAVVLVDAAVNFDDLAIHLVDPDIPLASKP